jgi:hypothetical protein
MATTVTLKPNAIDLSGSTSGTTTLQATAVAGTTTITLPAATDTLVGKATTDTLTNKTLTTPVISTISNTGTLTLPTSTDTLVGRATTDTLTNKTLTSPTLTTPALGTPASGVMTNVTGINYDGYKNRIINGAMVIDQRNAGTQYAPSGTGDSYTLDRYAVQRSVTGKFTVQQNANSVTPPTGYKNYLGVVSTSAYTVTAGDFFNVYQAIEGYNIADFGFGAAGASSITLSFWVRSSLTGTFGGVLYASGFARTYPFTYSISSANTWEQKSITIAGDTTGTWLTTNGVGLTVAFSMGVGSTYAGTPSVWSGTQYIGASGCVNVVSTNAATWYVTGVQLEKGSTATSFDYRPYGTELALCQRYYYKATASQNYTNFAIGRSYSSTEGSACFTLPVPMRATPTGSTPTVSGNFSYSLTVLTPVANYVSQNNVMTINCTGAFTATGAFAIEAQTTSAFIAWSAEL